MKLFALPEDLINQVLSTLQDLPFNKVNVLIYNIQQQAKLVVDANKNPVLVPDEIPTQVVNPETSQPY